MSLIETHEAWLEGDAESHLLQGNCSIGRAALNTLVLESPKVSRLHAIIHQEKPGEFWLVDLGSSNGTFLNKRRIRGPVRLRDKDQVVVGGKAFTFYRSGQSSVRTSNPLRTLQEKIEDAPCWLLVADIMNFTLLSRELASDKLATLVGSWLAVCQGIIEQRGGIVNKYLGDGILAFWHDDDASGAGTIVAGIEALKQAQARGPAFRFVVHFGLVAIGGVSSVKEESLMGSEVNLVFRLEKLAAVLGAPCGISDSAHEKLKDLLSCRSLGEHELKGFEGKRGLFAV